MRVWLIATLGFLSACSPLNSEERTLRKVEEQVRLKLNDPEAGKFRNLNLVTPELVCGEVNGKNRLGGYVGFRPFVVRLADGEIDVTIKQQDFPLFMTTDYPAEEFASCFPELLPELRMILGDEFPAPKGSGAGMPPLED